MNCRVTCHPCHRGAEDHRDALGTALSEFWVGGVVWPVSPLALGAGAAHQVSPPPPIWTPGEPGVIVLG